MSGAYVAKPAVVVPPDLPPGWNPNWPYPGSLPPGYAADYSLSLTAPASMSVGDTLDVSATLYDHDAYKTSQPATASRVLWTASVDGAAIPVRFSGDAAYASVAQSIYSALAGFWGARPTLDVQVTDEHNDKTLVLRSYSSVFNETLIETQEIAIGEEVATITGVVRKASGQFAVGAAISVGGYDLTGVAYYVELASAVTDSNGEYSVSISLSAASELWGLFITATAAAQTTTIYSAAPTEPGEYQQSDIEIAVVVSVVASIAFNVSSTGAWAGPYPKTFFYAPIGVSANESPNDMLASAYSIYQEIGSGSFNWIGGATAEGAYSSSAVSLSIPDLSALCSAHGPAAFLHVAMLGYGLSSATGTAVISVLVDGVETARETVSLSVLKAGPTSATKTPWVSINYTTGELAIVN